MKMIKAGFTFCFTAFALLVWVYLCLGLVRLALCVTAPKPEATTINKTTSGRKG